MNALKEIAKKAIHFSKTLFLSYPKKVQCNVCGWTGRRFLSDSWHKYTICPACGSFVRQRLFLAALQHIEILSFDRLILNKSILHFAPEDSVSSHIKRRAAQYVSADFLRSDCSMNLDISAMSEIQDESFDIVIAFDVLEHVSDYHKAIEEVRRILSSKGIGIFTVPQKDNLSVTYEDPAIVTYKDRAKHFGQGDHLRIFGDDFPKTLESRGFTVVAVNETMFSDELGKRHVLYPPLLSMHPLATNFRKVFFCQKDS